MVEIGKMGVSGIREMEVLILDKIDLLITENVQDFLSFHQRTKQISAG